MKKLYLLSIVFTSLLFFKAVSQPIANDVNCTSCIKSEPKGEGASTLGIFNPSPFGYAPNQKKPPQGILAMVGAQANPVAIKNYLYPQCRHSGPMVRHDIKKKAIVVLARMNKPYIRIEIFPIFVDLLSIKQ